MIVELWPYLASAAATVLWAIVLRRQLASRLGFALTAFVVCLIVVRIVDLACGYLVPLYVAGTAPPDPRNARLRFLITVGLQIPAALLVAYLVALLFRIRGRSPN